jgi:hypothetical protein
MTWTWQQTAAWLRGKGWTVEHLPLDDLPPYVWRSPDGVSGSDYRSAHGVAGITRPAGISLRLPESTCQNRLIPATPSAHYDAPPEAVMRHAFKRGDIHFTHLVAAE